MDVGSNFNRLTTRMGIPNSDAIHKLVAFPALQFFMILRHFSSTWTPTHLIKYSLQFCLTLLPFGYDKFEILLSTRHSNEG